MAFRMAFQKISLEVSAGSWSSQSVTSTYVLPKFFPHLEQENGFSRVSVKSWSICSQELPVADTYGNGNAG
jgi:hypothetical protein